MDKKTYKKSIFSGLFKTLGMFAVFIATLAVVLTGISGAGDAVGDEGARIALEAIRRAAVNCYALEGAYPESYEYLKKNYGLAVNEEKYAVFYSVFASNIMPEITVVPLGETANG